MDNFLSFAGTHLAWIWLFIAVICAVIEGMTLSLTTIWFAISAFIMVFISFTPLPFIVQFLIFAVVALLLLIFTRPVVQKKLNEKKLATNYERVIGQIAIVTKTISSTQKGTIKVNGMEWTASVKSDITLKNGAKCIIESIEGVTAFVKNIE